MKALIFCLAFIPVSMLAQTNRIPLELSRIHQANPIRDYNSNGFYSCDSMISYMFNPTLDSSKSQKNVYSYDSNGNIASFSSFEWNTTLKQWNLRLSDTSVYNANNKLVSQKRFMWGSDSKDPNSGWGTSNVYDAFGNQIVRTELKYDTISNKFINNVKNESFYNTDNYTDSSINYSWNLVTNSWNIVSKSKSNTLYHDDNLIIREEQIRDTLNDQWINSYKYEYTETDDFIGYVAYTWEKDSSDWIYSTKFDIELNDFGIAELLIYYNWDETSAQWIGSWKTEDNYDENGNRLVYVNYHWDKLSSEWIGDNKLEYTYSPDSSEIVIMTSLWNNIDKKWDIHSKEEYFYDEDGGLYLIIYSSWIADQWYLSSKFYSYNSWHNRDTNVLTQNDSQAKIRVYPNPVRDRISIDIDDSSVASIELFNFKGQLIKTLNVTRGLNTYDIRNLESGMYILRFLFRNQDELNFKVLKIDE